MNINKTRLYIIFIVLVYVSYIFGSFNFSMKHSRSRLMLVIIL